MNENTKVRNMICLVFVMGIGFISYMTYKGMKFYNEGIVFLLCGLSYIVILTITMYFFWTKLHKEELEICKDFKDDGFEPYWRKQKDE